MVLASARKNCMRMCSCPASAARIRREAMKATKKISADGAAAGDEDRITPSRCQIHAPSGGRSPGSPRCAPSDQRRVAAGLETFLWCRSYHVRIDGAIGDRCRPTRDFSDELQAVVNTRPEPRAARQQIKLDRA
jgi:hypothetical protein